MIEVVDAGIGNCIQDAGRFGYRSIGVPLAGAADAILLACANRLLGNEADQAALEIGLVGPRLRVASGSVRVALAGDISARILRADESRGELPPWQSATLHPGDMLAVAAGGGGAAYLALSGGCQVPLQLGSRATYARARIGGTGGRAVQAGDRIPCAAASGDPWLEYRGETAFEHPGGPLRVIPGPQDDYFEAAALESFYAESYAVSRELDRMGMRLHGPALAHRPDKGADIVSDGVVPGAIQVPANGQPIVLLADAQTVGGYPKIATVIAADLPRLAHCRPGAALRFAAVSVPAARAAWRAQAQALAAWCARIVSFRPPGVIDEAALYSANLVSGMVDARAAIPSPTAPLDPAGA